MSISSTLPEAETAACTTGAASPAAALDKARRIVVKIGSSLVHDARTGMANQPWLAALAADIAATTVDAITAPEAEKKSA